MSSHRHLDPGAFMRPVGIHTAWWRYPGGYPDASFNVHDLHRALPRRASSPPWTTSRRDAGLKSRHLRLVPEARRRGLFRRQYDGSTLRDHPGLPHPTNRFFALG